MNQPHTVSLDISGHPFSLETGKVAKQADGAVVVRFGGTMVLTTCVAAGTPGRAKAFFPFPVENGGPANPAGGFPGGTFNAEGGPVKKRPPPPRRIDRPTRPL